MSDESQELKPKRDPEDYREWRKRNKAAKAAQPTKLDAAPVAEPVVLEAEPATEVAQHQQPVERGHGDDNVAKPDITRPPRRLPIRTKGIWQTLSEPLREDIWAREIAFDDAFKRYDGLGKYVQQAQANGTSLQKALESYSALETAIRQDPIEGVANLFRQLGIDPKSAVVALADKYIPEGPKQAWEQGRIAGFIEGETAGAIKQFAATRSDFELLRPKMAALASATRACRSISCTNRLDMQIHKPERRN